MTATVSVRAYTGSGAGTESAALTTVPLSSVDDATSTDPVSPGSRSYERWLRLRLDSAPALGVANFWLENTGLLPDGVSILFGVTDTPVTPVDTPSTIAIKTLTEKQRFYFDLNTYSQVGEHSRYIVLQEAVASGSSGGAIPDQALQFGFQEK